MIRHPSSLCHLEDSDQLVICSDRRIWLQGIVIMHYVSTKYTKEVIFTIVPGFYYCALANTVVHWSYYLTVVLLLYIGLTILPWSYYWTLILILDLGLKLVLLLYLGLDQQESNRFQLPSPTQGSPSRPPIGRNRPAQFWFFSFQIKMAELHKD